MGVDEVVEIITESPVAEEIEVQPSNEDLDVIDIDIEPAPDPDSPLDIEVDEIVYGKEGGPQVTLSELGSFGHADQLREIALPSADLEFDENMEPVPLDSTTVRLGVPFGEGARESFRTRPSIVHLSEVTLTDESHPEGVTLENITALVSIGGGYNRETGQLEDGGGQSIQEIINAWDSNGLPPIQLIIHSQREFGEARQPSKSDKILAKLIPSKRKELQTEELTADMRTTIQSPNGQPIIQRFVGDDVYNLIIRRSNGRPVASVKLKERNFANLDEFTEVNSLVDIT